MKVKYKILSLFCLAIIFRLILLFISINSHGYNNFINDILLTPGNDPYTYNQLAKNIIEYKSFTYAEGLPPVSLRTPGYPLFIALIYMLFGINPIIVILVQILLDSLIVILIFLITKNFLTLRLSILTAFLYAIEPHASIFSLSMYSDTFFVFVLTLFAYFFIKHLYKEQYQTLILSAVLLAVANLIKPSGVFTPIIIIIILLFKFKEKYKIFIYRSVLFILTFILILSPWLIRNYNYFNKIFLSTAGDYNLLVLNITPIKMSQTNLSQNEAIFRLLSEADSLMGKDNIQPMFNRKPLNYWEELTLQYDFNKAFYWKKLAFIYISNYPFQFIRFYLIGILHSFGNLGTAIYSEYFNLKEKTYKFNLKVETSFIEMFNNFFKNKNSTEIFLALIIFLYLFIVYTGLIIGIVHFKKLDLTQIKLFLFSFFIYFILIAGSGGLARFKLPSIPFYLIISSVGLFSIYSFITKKINKIFRNNF